MDRYTPFLVMVGLIKRIIAAPFASFYHYFLFVRGHFFLICLSLRISCLEHPEFRYVKYHEGNIGEWIKGMSTRVPWIIVFFVGLSLVSKYYPRDITYMSVVKFIACLVLDWKALLFKTAISLLYIVLFALRTTWQTMAGILSCMRVFTVVLKKPATRPGTRPGKAAGRWKISLF